VIGPDEYHEHVDNNFYTNRMARWNLDTALGVLDWLGQQAPAKARQLIGELDLTSERLAHWRQVSDALYAPIGPEGLIEQFERYFQLPDVDAAALSAQGKSFQQILGIEGANKVRDELSLLHPAHRPCPWVVPRSFDHGDHGLRRGQPG
jgi:trehalose/maltose hydrolase-like predicted phosphorylase